MRRWLVRLALTLILGWSVAVAALLLFRHQLIYPFRDWPVATQVAGVSGARVAEVQAPDGIPVYTWVVDPAPGRPTILYFMGNAGSLPAAAPRLQELALAGFGVVALNYRGAGGAPGAPSQAALIADALAVYDALLNGPPVIYGTSLGAALATQVAAQRPVQALVLETPFARLCQTARHHYPWVPACVLLWDEHWGSVEVIDQINAPLLVLHGDADRIIPIAHGRALFDAARQPKEFVTYPGGRHNDLRLYGAGRDVIAFIEGLAP
ncbi:MAG: alpha/beta fold hydrolase [Pseudomonadota bacterium]